METKSLLLLTILLGSILGSSIYLVENTNVIRELNQEVWSLHRDYDEQLDNYGRLRLEHGALTSLSRVEQIATAELGMVSPDRIYEVRIR